MCFLARKLDEMNRPYPSRRTDARSEERAVGSCKRASIHAHMAPEGFESIHACMLFLAFNSSPSCATKDVRGTSQLRLCSDGHHSV